MSERDTPTNASFEATLRALAANYGAELPVKLAEISSLLRTACAGNANAIDLQRLHRQIHSLNGSAKTFGFPTVSEAARKLELAIAPHCNAPASLDHEVSARLMTLLGALHAAVDADATQA